MAIEIAIAVVERDGQFLIGLRPPGVRFAGYWEFPGGKALAGESTAVAAERECFEETGLRVAARSSLLRVSEAAADLQLDFIACEAVDGDALPLPPFRWVARAELAQYRFPPANDSVIELLLGHGR